MMSKFLVITIPVFLVTIRSRMYRQYLTFFVLTSMVFISHLSFSQTKDTLYFYNKTILVGELFSITLGRVEFDADGVGIVKIKNNKIESINATSRSFRVETVEGEELQGYLMRSDKPGMVLINAIVESSEIPLENITNLVYYGKTLKSRFTGNVSAGYSYTKSSEIGRLNSDGLIRYNTHKGITQVEGDMIVTYDSVNSDIERANLSASHLHSIAPLWGVIIILKYQRNLELGLQRRWQQAFGVGRDIFLNKHQQATLIGGVAINQENNQEGVESNTTEAMLQASYNLFSFASPNISLSFNESMFVSVTEKDRLRLDGNINLDYEIISDFYINLQFYHNYDSRSPATGDPNIDYGFVAGLRYKF